MRTRFFLLLAMMTGTSAAFLAACSGDDTNPTPVDAGSTDATTDHAAQDANAADGNVADTSTADTSVPDANVADSAVPDADAGAVDAADAADAAPLCIPPDGGDAGWATTTLEWNFTVSGPALNGNKGQVATINRCDSVIWHNSDTVSHGVVSTSGNTPFNTGTLAAGASSSPIQFGRTGVITYDCTIHGSSMIGQLTVQ